MFDHLDEIIGLNHITTLNVLGSMHHATREFAERKSILTFPQARVLEFIRRFRMKTKMSPTVREIGKGLGISSPNGVRGHLVALARKGAITWKADTARSIIPTTGTAESILNELCDGIGRGTIASVADVRRHLRKWRHWDCGSGDGEP